MIPGFGDKTRLRRQAAVHGYFGVNGSGKSLLMVHDTLASLDQGRPVWATLRIQLPDGSDHPLWNRLTDSMSILDLEHCDVLLDEIQGAVDARSAAALPVQLGNKLLQLRRADVTLRYTGLRFADADVKLRSATQAVTHCHGYMAKFLTDEDGRRRLWPTRRLFRYLTYDAKDFEELTAQQVRRDREARVHRYKPLAKQWFWREGSEAERSYQTLEAVSMLSHLSEAGVCGVCGGKRTHPRCSCSDEPRSPRSGRGTAKPWAVPE